MESMDTSGVGVVAHLSDAFILRNDKKGKGSMISLQADWSNSNSHLCWYTMCSTMNIIVGSI